MEVEQTRELNGLGLFGNSGGYIGMFLGCALMQVPEMLFAVYAWFYRLNTT